MTFSVRRAQREEIEGTGCGISARCFGYFIGFSILITTAAIIHTWHAFKTNQQIYKIVSLSVASVGVLTICICTSCYCSSRRKYTEKVPVISDPQPFLLQSEANEDYPVHIQPSVPSYFILQENPYSVPSSVSVISEVVCSAVTPNSFPVGPVYMTPKDIPVSSNNVYSTPTVLYATPSSSNAIQTNTQLLNSYSWKYIHGTNKSFDKY